MSAMQAEVFEAFRAIDVPEDKAFRAAASRARTLTNEIGTASAPQLADAAAVKTDMTAVKADVAGPKIDVAGLKGNVGTLKTDVTGVMVGMTRVEGELTLLKWMTGSGLAFLVAITSKLFLH